MEIMEFFTHVGYLYSVALDSDFSGVVQEFPLLLQYPRLHCCFSLPLELDSTGDATFHKSPDREGCRND